MGKVDTRDPLNFGLGRLVAFCCCLETPLQLPWLGSSQAAGELMLFRAVMAAAICDSSHSS